MGDQKKEEEEQKVPVFTVFKKNSILKNIYLDAPINSTTNEEDDEQDIVIGRHPDCSITLDHPSISRFHLRLHSKPSSLTLSLVDLSSVHGTWVSGKKVEPGVQVDLNEGDIVQLGASSRRYMLHWVPMSRANNYQQSDKENDENPQAPAGFLTGKSHAKILSGDHKKNLLMEEFEENEICGFSSGQVPSKAIEEIEYQQYDEEYEHSQDLKGVISGIVDVNTTPTIDHYEDPLRVEFEVLSGIAYANSSTAINHNRDEFEAHVISAFSSGQLLHESVLEPECQQNDEVCENLQALDGVLSGIADANSSTGINHNRDEFEEHMEHVISAFSSGQLLHESVLEVECQQNDEVCENSQALDRVLSGIAHANSSTAINHKDEFEEHVITCLLVWAASSESVLEVECQQNDEVCENSQALDGVLSGIAHANSSTAINHNRDEFEEHVISAFSSGQLLHESVLEVECQKNDEVCEKSQALDRVLSSIADANSNSTICNNEHPLNKEFEKNEISALTSVQILNESIVEIGNQQYNENEKDDISQAVDGIHSGIPDANSSSTLYQNENPLKKEFEKDEISAFVSVQIPNELVEGIGSQQYDEDEKDEICAFTSVQILNQSVAEIGIYQYNEDNIKSQAVDGVPSSVPNSPSLCHNYHCKNLSELFNSSFSKEDVDINCAKEDEQKKMSTSSCCSHCSSTTLESKDQLYLYENDHNVRYSSSSGVHAIQSLRNTPCKSDQESHWPEIMGHLLSDVGESSKALDDENFLKADNKQKEPTVITRAPKMDLTNFSICCESNPTEDCFGQLDGKNKTGQTFAINVSEPRDTDVNTPLRSGKQSDSPTFSGKPTSNNIQTGQCFPTNTEVKELYKENLDHQSVSEALISNVEVFAEEIFTPDKENFTPSTHKYSSTKKTNKLEEIKLSDPLCLLSSPTKNSICWNFVQDDELMFSSEKENHTPKVLQKSRLVQPAFKNSARLNFESATKDGTRRVPFKSLLSNSPSKSWSSNSGKYAQPIEKNAVVGDNKRWIMVADTNSLLNKVSRKALQLLQGVKGTQLIIPRVVIRELDCMKRRGYLFTKTEISSALQWINDCMRNTNWWIHVESLMEGGKHPTASSLSTSEGEIEDFAFSSTLSSAFPNFLEIVSPTPGDHILECALLNRRIKNDGNLVILSDDVLLKIKAMAEGIICEAAEEFRESLVNPFSDRFLWAKSSPRGLTWSCADDIVLREKYYRGPFKKPPSKSGESLKGLKLILVQNPHFRGLILNSNNISF
ncbi:LOW QUALITY PROTEIN: FHA domain-containing protein PS1 [Apium graveolens]|uniref:LOW QUALITY PROTEIN: FHA domain-containing protein PS1 n=1 Tax=Apium graveolens TaxID=4045 RepID=UPI003D7A0ED8